MVGWTYSKAYEASQKYKEGKFIIEKINLHMEESFYDVSHPAGERHDRWRKRSMSWGNGEHSCDLVYEYRLTQDVTGESMSIGNDMGSPISREATGIPMIGDSVVTPPSPPFL